MTTYKLFHPGEAFCEPSRLPGTARFVQAGARTAPLYRALYMEVAREWNWGRALHWGIPQWCEHLAAPGVNAAILMVADQPAGWYELRRDSRMPSIEIYYLALRRAFFGKGLARPLLRQAMLAAYSLKPSRLWLKTSTEDHPSALPLYLSEKFHLMGIEGPRP